MITETLETRFSVLETMIEKELPQEKTKMFSILIQDIKDAVDVLPGVKRVATKISATSLGQPPLKTDGRHKPWTLERRLKQSERQKQKKLMAKTVNPLVKTNEEPRGKRVIIKKADNTVKTLDMSKMSDDNIEKVVQSKIQAIQTGVQIPKMTLTHEFPQSKGVEKITYHKDTKTLDVKERQSGNTVRYSNVTKKTYDEFVNAFQPATYYEKKIKNKTVMA